MLLITIQIVGGLVALLGGGELLVRGASRLARRLGMSALVVGVLIVGFGTSLPELVTCIDAALRGAPGLAVGNIVGSNIANILLILGVAAVLRPFAASRAAVLRDGSLVIATALAFAAVAMTGTIGRLAGAVFVAALIVYLTWTYRHDQSLSAAVEEELEPRGGTIVLDLAFVVFGLVLLVGGATYLVDGSVALARIFQVSEEVIGLTLVAIGTSLPELATTIVAALRKESQIALGNVLGSNIFNTLGIAGITALVQPMPIASSVQTVDIPVMVAASVGLVLVVATGQKVTRREGGLLLGCYGGYLWLVAVT